MQTLFKLFLLLFSSFAFADNDFQSAFNIDISNQPYQSSADRITLYYQGKVELSSDKKKTELTQLASNINNQINKIPNSPVLHFLKGLNLSLLSGHYKNNGGVPNTHSITQEKITAYKQAIQLDNKDTSELSASAYSTMKFGLPQDDKIKAIQKELELGGNGDNESYYWFLHWGNISALLRADRMKEADQALNNMRNELRKSKSPNHQFHLIANLAQAELKNKKSADKLKAHRSRGTPFNYKSFLMWIITIGSILAILAVTYYELIIKRNNRS